MSTGGQKKKKTPTCLGSGEDFNLALTVDEAGAQSNMDEHALGIYCHANPIESWRDLEIPRACVVLKT